MSICIGLIVVLIAAAVSACGREPSRLLRQGQLPIYDFPLYLTEGAAGRLWKLDRDRTKTLVADGLSDPRGVATDRFHNVYVAEYGSGRLLKITEDGTRTTLRDGLLSPSVVAVDSFGEVYVAQDGARDVVRASDGEVFAQYATLATALTFGVNDQVVVGLYDENRVQWGWDSGDTADVTAPVAAQVDGTGRVYVAEGAPTAGKLHRFHQQEPGEAALLADGLVGPLGIAVDLVGDVFVVEQGANRVILITYDGIKYSWVAGLDDPQYLAFTQY